MNRRLKNLEDLTSDFIQRKGPEVLLKQLPPKHEHVLLLRLSLVQELVYLKYLQVWLPCARACVFCIF